MKCIYLLIVSIGAASLVPSQSRAERTLDALFPSRFKQGSIPSNSGEALIANVTIGIRLPGETRPRYVKGHCITAGLSKKYPGFFRGRNIGIPYYVFKGDGKFSLSTESRFERGMIVGPAVATFELILGQRVSAPGATPAPLGKLTVKFNNGTGQTFVIPDSFMIRDASPASITGTFGEGQILSVYFWVLTIANGQVTALP